MYLCVCACVRACTALQHCVHIPFKVCLVVLMLPSLSRADDDITVVSTARGEGRGGTVVSEVVSTPLLRECVVMEVPGKHS